MDPKTLLSFVPTYDGDAFNLDNFINCAKHRLQIASGDTPPNVMLLLIMELRQRTSPEQFSDLLDFMERHEDISRPQPGPQGRARSNQLWTEVTTLLNSLGGGVQRSSDKWRKVAPAYENFVEVSKAVGVEDDIDKDALYEEIRVLRNTLEAIKKQASSSYMYYVFVDDVSKGRSKP
ncbi:unnamed protein product [Colias eurytheme]|nr:unnamed protein product [Colias eurytheme]